MKKRTAVLLVLSILALMLGACTQKEEQQAKGLKIVTSFYPVYAMVKEVSGDLNDVRMIQSSTGIHSFEPSANDVAAIYDADVFVYHSHTLESWAGSLDPNLQKSKVKVLEASEGMPLERVPGLEDVEASEGIDEKTLYDVLLNDYEKGMDTERLDVFFSELKKEIVPFLKKIQEKKKTIKEVDKISVPIDEDVQLKFAKFLSSYVGFDFEKGLVETSEHPFTLNLNKNDVRLTTKNKKDSPMSTVFSIIHESGHGIYEQQTADELIDTLLGTGGSMGLHESQSRFMENIVGENKAFWKPLYSKAGEFYPFLKDLEFEEFYKQINRIEPGLIRVEADELTYSLHIMLRYEIEKMLINGEVNIDDLPKIWNEKVKEYLGLEPQNDSEGLMQDIHWYCGLIGYFPSYAIGNAYASQIYNAMKKDFDVEKALENQDLKKITDWLGEKIHKYGLLKDTPTIIKEVTGEELNPKYYIEYLKEKYSKIYEI